MSVVVFEAYRKVRLAKGHTGLLVYRISQPKLLGKMNLFETEFLRGKSQPITTEMVEMAYRKVRSNGGAAGVDGKDLSYMNEHKTGELIQAMESHGIGQLLSKGGKGSRNTKTRWKYENVGHTYDIR